jgi:serine/threonine protein kinase
METKRICPSCQKPLPTDVPMGLCPECLIQSGFNTETDPGNLGKGPGFVPPPVEELRKLFPRLEILELIGKGGMGAVYRARQPALDRFVALKILPSGVAIEPGFPERFTREARALARLNHPHIVAVHDFGQAGGQPYLVMEFVDGPNLRQVEQAGRLTPEQALEIVPQICEALQFAHNEGIVHRDIKPENILLDKRGRVKITDFGIAKIIQPLTPPSDTRSPSDEERVGARGAALTGAKDMLGTPHYMAPEQVEKPATVDHRADIYSLGVVFYELLTGELPLGKFQPPSKKVQVDVRLDEVVLHTLEKEPERRYQQASQVKTDVESIARTPVPRGAGHGFVPTEAAHPRAAADTNRNAKEATMVFAGSFFFLFLLAIVLELSRASAIPFKGFLILVCILGLLICALSLAGLWPFPSPWFPEPNFSSRNLRRQVTSPHSRAEPSPRFSRAAIIGAAWAPWFFIAAVLFFTTTDVDTVLGSLPPDPDWWQVLLGFTVLPLGLTAPFGTTILGGISISQIRHARGRLYGLGLAVFDVLLFPLLLLDILVLGAVVFGVSSAAASGAVNGMTSSWAGYWWLWLAVLGVIVLVDWLIIRAVWRAANKPVIGDPTPTPSTLASPPPPRSVGHTWKSATVILLILAIPVGALLIAGLMKMQSRDRIVQGEVIAEVPIMPSRAVRFGPAREVILNDLDEARGNEALSFASGQLLSLPADFGQRTAKARAAWLDSNRVDLLAQMTGGGGGSGPGFVTADLFGSITERVLYSVGTQRPITGEDFDNNRQVEVPAGIENGSEDQFFHWLAANGVDLMAFAHKRSWALWASPKLAAASSALWEHAQLADLHAALRSGEPGLMLMEPDVKEGFAVYGLSTNTPMPLTLAFETRAGRVGLLQFMGFTESPLGVRIRYKLAQSESKVTGDQWKNWSLRNSPPTTALAEHLKQLPPR